MSQASLCFTVVINEEQSLKIWKINTVQTVTISNALFLTRE